MEDQDSSPELDLTLQNARKLTELYFECRERVQLRRTLEECLANERQKVSDLYVAYLPYLAMRRMKFLRGEYFRKNDRFIRFQEMPEEYLTEDVRNYYFISHRWLGLENPDPDGTQFALVSGHVRKLKEEVVQTWGFWYDYSCIPQRDASGKRSPEEEEKFQSAVKVMHLLPMLSSSIMLFDTSFMNRAWCFMEWACATKISPILAEGEIVPFFNHIKFRHVALLVLYLMKDEDYRVGYLNADETTEQMAIAHLNSLIGKSLASCESTIPDDKALIVSMMYEHFWNHLRLLGFRTQLMTAWRLMEQLDEESVQAIFLHFLAFSEDPAMNWTKETTFIAESVLSGLGNPTDMVFHREEVVERHSSKVIDPGKAEEPSRSE